MPGLVPAQAFRMLGCLARLDGDPEGAQRYLRESVVAATRLSLAHLRSDLLVNLGALEEDMNSVSRRGRSHSLQVRAAHMSLLEGS